MNKTEAKTIRKIIATEVYTYAETQVSDFSSTASYRIATNTYLTITVEDLSSLSILS